MRDKELLSLLKKNGWQLVRVKGSHHRLEKEGFPPITNSSAWRGYEKRLRDGNIKTGWLKVKTNGGGESPCSKEIKNDFLPCNMSF